MNWIRDLKSSSLIIGLSIVVASMAYIYVHRYTVHTAYGKTVVFDHWSGTVTVTEVGK